MAEFRANHWAASLTEEQRWTIYYQIRSMRWTAAQEWILANYNVAPGKNGIYQFRTKMRSEEHAHRMEECVRASLEAKALADGRKINDKDEEAAYRQLAIELALATGSAKEAAPFVQMAVQIADRRQKEAELKLKKEAQKTKDEQLKLAREKFEAAEKRLAATERVVSDGALTDAERTEKLKRIFGIQ